MDWLLLQSNSLSYATTVVFVPLYVIFVRPCLPRCLSHILSRLRLGACLLVLSTLTMLVIEGWGHRHAIVHGNFTNISCFFLEKYQDNEHTLQFHTATLALPAVLSGVALPFLYITVLEFISAQSHPHTMKGLILGTYYAVRGFFIIMGCLFVLPFAQKNLWKG